MSFKPLIAANWKMNSAPRAAQNWAEAYTPTGEVDVIVFSTPLDLRACIEAGLVTGAQFGHPFDQGPRTGDISMKMLRDHGCQYVLCGHSERRQYHKENNKFVAEQVVSALSHGLIPILCVGETEDDRKEGHAKEIVRKQLEAVLREMNQKQTTKNQKLIIAYEPVWAIGTNNTATPGDAQEMHEFIRSLLPTDLKDSTRIIYGGSMKSENAASLLSQPDIDGGLIGGASLDPEQFQRIVAIAAGSDKGRVRRDRS